VTAYADLSSGDEDGLLGLYRETYAQAPFVRVYAKGELPALRNVRGSNYADIGLRVDARTGRAIVIACTDNLMKGAASQAVQNMNLMFGLDEAMGLDLPALAV
jgi:N-acetyl-gamma-glutamyl-phosphate reductase